MNSKNSQINQVFIYILTLIVFALILVYGYNAISKFISKGEEIGILQIKKELENSIQKTSRDFGSVVKKQIQVPGKFSRICFVDIDKSNFSDLQEICNPSNDDEYNAIVCDSWKSNTQFNTFLIESNGDMESFFIGEVQVDSPFYDCINIVQNRVTLRLEGTGGQANLREWQ